MKTSKRVLSVFMAMLMVIMSVSAGFVAFAAEDPWDTLVNALKSENVMNASYGANGYMTTVSDPTGDVEKAADAFWEVAKTIAEIGNNGDDNGTNQPRSAPV